MKKRAFAWILLLMLLVTLLPAAVSAAGADRGSTEAEPLLTARYYDWNEKKTSEYNRLSSAADNSLQADSVQCVVFFYGDKMIPRSALVTTGKIDIAAAEDEQIPKAYQGYVCELRLGSFKTGKIMYVNTDTHTTIAELSVTGALPFIGLFQTAKYLQDSYIWDGTDVKTLPDTVYLLGNEQTTITDVSVERGGELVTAKAPQEGETAWKLHLNKGVSDSSWVNLHMTYEDQQSSGTRRDFRLSFNWTDTTPHLYLRDFNGNTWTMDTLHYGETIRTNICFGSGDTTDPVLTASKLTSEKGSIVLEQQETRIAVYAEYKDRVTEDAIVYNAPDGKTYRMPFRLALPELGIYRDTSWSASSLVGAQQQTFDQGTKPELYLHWTCNADEIKSISVSGSDGGMDFTISDLLNADTYPELYGVTFEVHKDEGYVKFVPMITSSNWYQFCLESQNGGKSYADFNSHSSFNDPTPLPVVTIDGVEYTFGLGTLDFGEALLQFGSGSGFGSSAKAEDPGDFDYDVLLTIFSGSETSERAEAPTWLYDCVKDVSFRLTGIANMLADGSSVVPGEGKANVTLQQQPNLTLRGRSIPRVRLHADAGKFFCARLELTFTLDLTKYDLGTKPYTVGNGALYVCSGEAHFAVDESMTADELNEVLSTADKLHAFLQEADPDAYRAYRLSTANSFTGDYSIILDLPDVAYNKPIVLAADHPSSMLLCLNGTMDENKKPLTKLCGLHLDGSSLFHLSGIAFDPACAADESSLLTFNDRTCAVLGTSYSGSDDMNNWVAPRLADIGGTYQCSFTGFGYGLVSTESSYFAPPNECVFHSCGVGLYYDCKNKTYGMYGSYSGRFNTFVQCDTAILIESLPASGEMFSPYMFRFLDNTFINAKSNALDFDVRTSGKFYFYRNAYNDSENAELLKYRPVQLSTGNGAIVITNPCCLPDGTLFIQAGQYTEIINSMSDELVISDVSDLVTVNVVGDNGQSLGTWTLYPKAKQKAKSAARSAAQPIALYADSSAKNGLNPGIQIDNSQSESILVTVADSNSESFEALRPMLTVACPFSTCYVTFDGAVISSALQDGKVTFPVRAGGSYTVHEGPVPANLSATRNGVSLTVSASAEYRNGTALLFAAEYDAGGRLLAVQSKPVELGKSTYDFTLQSSNTNVKCFLLSTKAYAPLTEPFSIR